MRNGTLSSRSLPGSAGIIQFDVKLGVWPNNLKLVVKFTDRLAPKRGSLLVLPELWATGFDYGQLKKSAEKTPDFLFELQNLASKYDVVFAGSLVEAARKNDQDIFYNTLFVTDSTGVCGQYRKLQLFGPMAEDRYFGAGDKPLPIQTPYGLVVRRASWVCALFV